MKIKICGITRAEDAELAVELGAWAVGFIFYEKSPRSISVSQAKAIIQKLPPHIEKVGVFANEMTEKMLQIQQETGITTFQLHGEETPESTSRLPSFIKAIRPRNEADLVSLTRYGKASHFLVDAYDSSRYGGTGIRVEVPVALAAKHFGPLILAGGLNSDNVADVIRQVTPIAVDVSSGVESSPGVKDSAKLRKFFEAVRSCGEC